MKTSDVFILCMALAAGGAVITGLANALGEADEKAPIADLWLAHGRQLDIEMINDRVRLRRTVSVDAARLAGEAIVEGFDGGLKSLKPDLQAAPPPSREEEEMEERQGSTAFEGKGPADRSRGLRADRVKKMIILYSLYLRSIRPLGPV